MYNIVKMSKGDFRVSYKSHQYGVEFIVDKKFKSFDAAELYARVHNL